ncbi:MAG: helix-turn-helix transcriptional regulator [Alphaproteobacteria bacterium]
MDVLQSAIAAGNRCLSEREVSGITGLSLATIRRMRWAGEGPAFVRLSERRIAYRAADLDRWLDARRCGEAA